MAMYVPVQVTMGQAGTRTGDIGIEIHAAAEYLHAAGNWLERVSGFVVRVAAAAKMLVGSELWMVRQDARVARDR